MVEFEFNFMINSQILWGDYDTVPGLAIYQLIRPENAKFVLSDPLYLEWKSKGDAYRRGIVKAEEKQKLMQECLQYFRERCV